MEHIQGINDLGTVFVALAVTVSLLFVGAAFALKVEDKHVKLVSIAGALLLFVGFMGWRSSAPFLLPSLSL